MKTMDRERVSAGDVKEMRWWLCDNCTSNEEAGEVAHLSDREVQRVVERCYPGGINQFILDSVEG